MITIYIMENAPMPIILNFNNETTRLLSRKAGLELEKKIHEANKILKEIINEK